MGTHQLWGEVMSDLGIAYHGPEKLSMETLPTLLSRIEHPPNRVAVDTETVSLKDRTCVGVGVAFSRTEAIYFRMFPDESPYIGCLQSILCNPQVLKIYHNALFDLGVLAPLGYVGVWDPIDMTNIADTSTAARVQGSEASLSFLSMEILGIYIAGFAELLAEHKAKNSLDIPWPAVARKCLDDCMATYGLYEELL